MGTKILAVNIAGNESCSLRKQRNLLSVEFPASMRGNSAYVIVYGVF